MISIETDVGGALLEVTMSGEVSREDYENALVPAVEKALQEHDRLRLLILFGGFEKFDLGAAWADTKLGLSHWGGFDRVAVATDPGWIATGIRMMAPLMPCPVQVFAANEADDARRWLRESLGAVHLETLDGGILKVQLMGEIDPEAIARAEEGLDAHIREHGRFKLLLDLTEFDGWRGLPAIGSHFKLVREHAPLADRIAVLGDKAWQNLAQRAARRFLKAESKFFEGSEAEEARAWLAG